MYTVRQQRQKRRWVYLTAAVTILIVYCAWAMFRPLPSLRPVVDTNALQARAGASTLQWPAQGQSAVGVLDTSIMETHGNQQPVPIASTAKLITVLTVLQAKPIASGSQGAMVTLGPSDVALYNNYQSQDGSLVRVQDGEQISEYQMLQAIMLPSANNMADSLAIWAFGSLKNYQQAANQYLESQGIVETHVGDDASGFSPSTTSTARDLVKIGELAMKNQVLAQIVGQSSASGIPVVGNIQNVNKLLGVSGIVGIKTGNTDQAGGVFVSASKTTVNGKPVTIVTALAGSPGLWQAMNDSVPLIKSAQANFKPVTIPSTTTVASYKQPWGEPLGARAAKSISLQAWGGSTVSASPQLRNIKSSEHAGAVVGAATIAGSALNDRQSTSIYLQQSAGSPSVWWRLSHPI